jgi:antigen flippase
VASVAVAPRRSLLVASASALWGAQVLTAVTGVLRGKVNAVALGPAGVGVVAQLNYLSTLIATLAAFGLWNGCIRALADARGRGDETAEARVTTLAFVYPLGIGVVAAIVIAAAAGPVSGLLFQRPEHAGGIIAAAISAPLGLGATAVAIVLQGRGAMKRVAGANAICIVANTAVVVALVLSFGLTGAIIAVAATSALQLGVMAVREPSIFRQLRFDRSTLFDRRLLRDVYGIGGAAVVLSIASSANDIALRSIVVHRLGIAANGLYQPAVLVSTQLFLGLIGAIGVYLFPTLTTLLASNRPDAASSEFNRAIRLLLFAVVPIAVVVAMFTPELVTYAFSSAFGRGETVLRLQVAGEIWRALAWSIGAILLPLGLVRAWLGIGLATLAVQVGLAAALIPFVGLRAVAIAYGVSWIVNTGGTIWVIRRRNSLRVDRRTWMLAVVAVAISAVVAADAYWSQGIVYLTGAGCLAVWAALAIRGREASLTSRFAGRRTI